MLGLFYKRFSPFTASLLFAAAGTGALALGVGLIWHAFEQDNAASVQQSIGDAASLLGTQVRLEGERLERLLLEAAQEKIKPELDRRAAARAAMPAAVAVASALQNPAAAQAALNPAAPPADTGAMGTAPAPGEVPPVAVVTAADTFETESEISDVALWRRAGPDAPASGAERAFVAFNPRFGGTPSEASAHAARLVARIQELESANRARIEPAFHGHGLVLSDPFVGSRQPMALVAVPIGHGEVTEVVAAHVSLDKIQRLFAIDGLVQSKLVDADGLVLADADPANVGHRESDAGRPLAPMFAHLSAAAGIESGLQALSDPRGQLFYGGFRRISAMGITVLASVPAEQVGLATAAIRHQLLAYLALVFMILAGGRYLWLTRRAVRGVRKAAASANSGAPPAPDQTARPAGEGTSNPALTAPSADSVGEIPSESLIPARRVGAATLHGSLRGFNQLLETAGAEETAEALNDYLTTCAAIVRAMGGHFESYPGASFGATWELSDETIGGPDAATRAALATHQVILCALRLRQELEALNQSRKLDGKKLLKQGMGLHAGQVLSARLGPLGERRLAVTGEAVACARALDRLALAEGKDLVMSQEVLRSARGTFAGKSLGEARLTPDTGLTAYFSVVDFRPDLAATEAHLEPGTFGGTEPAGGGAGERLTGGETRVQIARPEAAPARWLINNGSQIVGPFTAAALSQMLFAQELDFDCECWHEETGRSARLEEAGVFSGSPDAGACFWVYDDGMVHGPVSEGFIRTAVQHGALGEGAWVCEGSTVLGWHRALDWVKPAANAAATTDRKPDTGSAPSAA